SIANLHCPIRGEIFVVVCDSPVYPKAPAEPVPMNRDRLRWGFWIYWRITNYYKDFTPNGAM
ncbi:MAG: hypothetical protein R6X09_03200, partial [Bacteroidales bacterium]